MELNQILRIPIKYGELINTMSDEDCGKLMKAIFEGKDDGLEGVTKVYYNIIMADVINLYNASVNGKKGGRPKTKTNGNEEKKPGVSKKENQGIGKTETNTKQNKTKQNKTKQVKNKYGEYKNILLTTDQREKLIKDHSEEIFNKYVKILDEGIQMKGYKYKDHNLAMRNWIRRDNEQNKSGEINTGSASDDYEKQKAAILKRQQEYKQNNS